MNLLSSFASWFEGDSASVAFALVGGFIVACGLGIEKIAEMLNDRFLGGYNAHKTLDWFGWGLLMFGIWVEIADAGWTAHVISEAEKAQQKQAEQLLSVSNSAAMNSPSNFPISSVEGFGYIVINKNDASMVIGLENKRAVLELLSEPPTNSLFRNPMLFGGVFVEGIIRGVGTNGFGNPEVSFEFRESNLRQAGGGPQITFNKVAFVRLDICSQCQEAEALSVEKGFLNLELNSEFEFSAEFEFPAQTNRMQSIFGIRNKDRFR